MTMALDLATARKAAQDRGESPPPDYPGGPDAWVMDWFRAGVEQGDPDLVRRAGGTVAEGGGAEDLIAPWQDAADSSEWMGIRKPTPAELRKWANTTGRSEDYARFADRQLADWIGRKWDVAQGTFFNDFGDRVDKPTESGPLSHAAGYATGEQNAGRVGGGGGGGRGPQAPAQPPEAVTRGKPGEISYTGNPMTDMLIYQFNNRDMLGGGGGPNIFGMLGGRSAGEVDPKTGERKTSDITGQLLKGGGLWWTDTPGAKETFAGYGEAAPKAKQPAPGAPAPAAPDLYTKTPGGPGVDLDRPVPPFGGPRAPAGGRFGDMLLNKRKQGYFGQPQVPLYS